MKLLPLLLFLLFSTTLPAQDTPSAPPLVDTLNEWYQITGLRITSNGHDGTHRFRFSRDTVVRSGKAYRQLELSGDRLGGDDTFRDWRDTTLMRQEGGIVYRYAPGATDSEIIAYDFTLEPGDTFRLSTVESPSGEEACLLEVTRIDTLQLSNGERRRMISLGRPDEFSIQWIDGIGDVTSLGNSSTAGCLLDVSNTALLRCHYREGELLYAKPDNVRFQGCWQDSLTSLPALDPLPELTVFPNPATTHLTLTGLTPAAATLHDLTGRTVATYGPVNELPLGDLPAGLYLLRLLTDDGRSGVRRVIIR